MWVLCAAQLEAPLDVVDERGDRAIARGQGGLELGHGTNGHDAAPNMKPVKLWVMWSPLICSP